MNQVYRTELRSMIEDTNGRLFGICFIKNNGVLRRMVARTRVRKGVKDVEKNRAEVDKAHNLVTAYDFNADRRKDTKGGFRRINLDTVKWIRISGTVYSIKEEKQ